MRSIDRPALLEPDAGNPDTTATNFLELRDYVGIIRRRRWVVAGIMTIGLLCGVLDIWMTEPVFEGRATVQIDMDLNVLGVERPLMPVDQRDWMREFLPTQLGILQSRGLARVALEALSEPSGSGGGDPTITSGGSATSLIPDTGTGRMPTLNEIVAGRTVSQVRDTRLINIGFRSTDPVLSARVANALARAYLQENIGFRAKTSGEASDWLVKQVEAQRALVTQNEAAMQQYREEHGADALVTDKLGAEPQNVVVQKLAALQAAETTARTETIEREAQYRQLLSAQANQEPLETVPAIASNPYIQALKADLAVQQRQHVQASEELGELHPEFIKLREAAQSTERKLQTELANAARTLQNDFEAARRRERQLVAALRQQMSEVQVLNGKAVEYAALDREATTNRDVLDQLQQRSREAALAGQLESTNVRILDWAEVPVSPILPRKERTLTIALAGSGGLALGLVFLLELFNSRLRSPADVRQHLGISVVGVVPQVKQEGRASLLLGNGAPTRFAELFHSVRTHLVLAPQFTSGHTLLVTSAEPSEGKTVSAANVAVSLARLNQRVILIDADLRRPQLHEMFGIERQPGLADVLTGKTTSHDIRETKVPGLWLLPAGNTSHYPPDLFGSARFTQLIEYLRGRFDWIVLDSSPVLAVTDACLIARVASGVLLVVDSAHTSRKVAAAAVEQLEGVGANIVGAVLNRVVLDRPGESYLPYYHRDHESYYAPQGIRLDVAAPRTNRGPEDSPNLRGIWTDGQVKEPALHAAGPGDDSQPLASSAGGRSSSSS